MSCSGSHVVATVIGVIGLLMLLGSVGTSSWMTGCLSMDNFMKSLKEMGALPPGTNENALSILSGSFCINQGLFSVSVTVAGYSMHLAPSLASKPTYIYVVGAFLLVGMIVAVVGVILFIIASCKNDETYDAKARKRNITRVAFIVMACSGLVLTVGMAVYAGKTAEMVHNPMLYLVQYGQSAFSSMSGMFQGNGNPFGNTGRGKRDIDDHGENTSFDSAGLGESMNFDSADANNALDAVKTMFQGMDPNYGFSFILGWLSVVLFFISAITGFYAQHVMVSQSYNGPDGIKL